MVTLRRQANEKGQYRVSPGILRLLRYPFGGDLFGGVFVIFLIAFLVAKFTKYGGGSNYGMTGEFDDFNDDFDDFN